MTLHLHLKRNASSSSESRFNVAKLQFPVVKPTFHLKLQNRFSVLAHNIPANPEKIFKNDITKAAGKIFGHKITKEDISGVYVRPEECTVALQQVSHHLETC